MIPPRKPQEKPQSHLLALILTTRWLYDASGVSMVTRSLVNNVRFYDPEGSKVKITCALLEEDTKIEPVQLDDAEKQKVKLSGATLPKGSTENGPKPEWMNHLSASYYNRVINDNQYTYIIGHAPYSAHGGANLKDVSKSHESPKVVLMVHGLPKQKTGKIDKETLDSWLENSDIVFSVGKTVESELKPYLGGKKVQHHVYIPLFPIELRNDFEKERNQCLEGDQRITVMGSNELNFELAVVSSCRAACDILKSRKREKYGKITFTLAYITNEQKKTKAQRSFDKIVQRHGIQKGLLKLIFLTSDSIENFVSHISHSSVFLYPLYQHVTQFGVNALSAAAVGVPILVSKNCGMATLLQNSSQNFLVADSVVSDAGHFQQKIKLWKNKIAEKLKNPKAAQKQARQLREALLEHLDSAESHQNFFSVLTCEYCTRGKIFVLLNIRIF